MNYLRNYLCQNAAIFRVSGTDYADFGSFRRFVRCHDHLCVYRYSWLFASGKMPDVAGWKPALPFRDAGASRYFSHRAPWPCRYDSAANSRW